MADTDASQPTLSQDSKTESTPPQDQALLLTKKGQKFQTPTPGDADRVFYESLYKQKPSSVMAQNFVVEYGLLPDEEHDKLYEIYIDRKRNGGVSSSPVKKEVKKESKKRKVEVLDGMGGDTGFEGTSGMEGIGVGAI